MTIESDHSFAVKIHRCSTKFEDRAFSPCLRLIRLHSSRGQGEAVHDSLLKAEAALWTWKQVETGGELWAVGDFFSYGTSTRNGESIREYLLYLWGSLRPIQVWQPWQLASYVPWYTMVKLLCLFSPVSAPFAPFARDPSFAIPYSRHMNSFGGI